MRMISPTHSYYTNASGGEGSITTVYHIYGSGCGGMLGPIPGKSPRCVQKGTNINQLQTQCVIEMGNSVKSYVKDTEQESNELMYERSQEDEQLVKKVRQVGEKLDKAFGNDSKMGENERKDLAEKLVDKDKTKQEFFSHLLKVTENARKVVNEEKEAFSQGFPNQITRQDSEARMAEPLQQVGHLEVKLVLHELRDSQLIREVAELIHKHVSSFRFGPFHASVLIGDVVLEWRPNSLVIPRRMKRAIHKDEGRPVLFTNIHETQLDGQLPTVPLQYETGVDDEVVASRFETIKDITREKDQLIDELADLCVRYNTKMHYGMFTNNCQQFVLDVLTVLGITNPESVFRGKLKQHANLVMARYNRKATVEFNSHQELDQHVREQKADNMTRDDLEFAYCHYLLFHAWGRSFPHEEAWRCKPSECQADVIARLIH